MSASTATAKQETLLFGSACTGIGGIDLGLRQSGMSCKFQCEILPYDRALLAQNFPECTVRFADVRTIGAHNLPRVDAYVFGFMCTDLASVNVNAKGLDADTRSGITWRECIRVGEEIKPRFIVIENVDDLYGEGLDIILQKLAALGYDAEWHCLPAAYAGAPHQRPRIFILAYAHHVPGLQAHTPSLSFGAFWEARKDARRSYWQQAPAPDWAVPAAVSVRMANGLPYRVDRVKGTGNSVCVDIPRMIGEWLQAAFLTNGEGIPA